MPPPLIVLKYPERDYNLIFKRINSSVLTKKAKTLLYVLVHERIYKRERGFRIMPGRYDSPLCGRGCGLIETSTHKYATCVWVSSAWQKVLDYIFAMEPTLVFESSQDILNLNFSVTQRDNAILWLIGHYLEFIEEHSVIENNRVFSLQIMGLLSGKLMECKYKAMPDIGIIPGLSPSGIG